MKWESPRGPIMIDPETRDVVETIYINRVEKVGGKLVNVESTRSRTSKTRCMRRRSEEVIAGLGRTVLPILGAAI